MNDTFFISDATLFSNSFSFIIESKDQSKAIEVIKEKQKREKRECISVEDKQVDLYIWNAFYTKEIIRNGVSKQYLHNIYNKFLLLTRKAKTVEKLNQIEIEMIETYFSILIYDVEVTESYIVNRILQFLHMNIESPVSLERIAEHLDISVGYASVCFKNQMGVSLMKYAKEIKIERAKTLLLSTNKSVLEISELLGFYDQSHFSRTFKSFVNMTPLQFRNQCYA